MAKFEVLLGDNREILNTLPECSINTCVTSPPYFALRDYHNDDQIGTEDTPEEYVNEMVKVFQGVKRVLRDDGTLWLNIGDTFGKNKNLLGIPWLVAFALQKDGWILRSDIVWHKTNPMPESVKDRPTRSHEYFFLLAKNKNYYYDIESTKTVSKHPEDKRTENGHKRKTKEWQEQTGLPAHSGFNKNYETANLRDVWSIATNTYKGAHFATFPLDLIKPCIVAGCPVGGTVLDPFSGSGTTGIVACMNDRNYLGIELNSEYHALSYKRYNEEVSPLTTIME